MPYSTKIFISNLHTLNGDPMKLTWLFLISILLIALFCSAIVYNHYNSTNEVAEEDFFFGVSFGGNTTSQAKQLIDINSWEITINETALNEICDYALDANLNFMVFFDFISHSGYPWDLTWLDTAKERWGDSFLGIYLYDEPGGRQLGLGQWDEGIIPKNISDYGEAAEFFVTSISSTWGMQDLKERGISVFTSDFVLYWFDYLAGYDAIFVEFGWNNSRPQQVALGRGAANVQNKEWGTIITWTYQHPPYIENATQLLEDLKTAYRGGPKYLVVFDFPYNQTNPYGILTEEHFDAMETFWNMTDSLETVEAEAAFILPKDYGWGMRSLTDNIWFPQWGPDSKSPLIWENMNKLIRRYDLKLDIIYDEPRFGFEEKYFQIYLWNDQITLN